MVVPLQQDATEMDQHQQQQNTNNYRHNVILISNLTTPSEMMEHPARYIEHRKLRER